jgi:ubiquitin-protein ligase
MNLRLKRLINDYDQVRQYLYQNPYIVLTKVTGNPPERYQLEYRVKSIQITNGMVSQKDANMVEIILPLEYPSLQPQCRMLTPVYHPNIAPHAICIADHWAAGESLKDVIIRIGEMLSYQNYSIKSPLNGEAAKWAHENRHRFPLDLIDFRSLGNISPENGETHMEDKFMEIPAVESKPAVENKPPVWNIHAQAESSCSNCGSKGATEEYVNCKNGHYICPDCQIKCHQCGKKLCIICESQKCPVCGKIECSDCLSVCHSCSKSMCSTHIKECLICGEKGCTMCLIECPQCGKHVCSQHFKQNVSLCFDCYYK